MNAASASDPRKTSAYQRLRLFNALMVPVHVLQGVAILVLSTDFALPVTTSFLEFDEPLQKLVTVDNTLFDLRIAPLIAAFLFISAADHLLLSLPWVFPWYARNLARGINYARWWEYAVSASIMIVVIAMLAGMYDLPSLILVFALTATMIFWGLMMEVHNQTTERVNWTAFAFGSVVGVVPWIAIGLYLFGPGSRSLGEVPTFVYGIYVSLFIWFALFAVNMLLQYRKVGPWRDYLFGERMYIVLSLTAKSALAWQTFGGTLRDV